MPHVVPLSAPEPVPGAPVRPRPAVQVAGVVAFPSIGGVLAMSGMALGDVIALVSSLGAVGVAAVVACVRLTGRHTAGTLAAAFAAAAVHAAQEPRP
ncbi:hypothetical protein O3Q52_47480 [Streptomyces sp. ActVer]|uniref:hypothetical protein n=1 Tax=Streptomyces sp. ActVer TaxID=3014558 RepID=UPI0022B2BEEA|nr:hypothetical protein [Streptomyces sp. ActVer]MCZ4515627.1 hypothetical protein [Streptomyces sp. ActVer]